ncbi:unnamed protein product [Dibothriocephalus latus]|uniref:Uncharacterized protein n=1 Tax=Dibothriocephalus latus TaxID=60516 RepID=A0A3P7LNR8_DIBLA|nr:unnamed protein product [Dibothriocephalus latus]
MICRTLFEYFFPVLFTVFYYGCCSELAATSDPYVCITPSMSVTSFQLLTFMCMLDFSKQISNDDLAVLDDFYNWGKDLPSAKLDLIGKSLLRIIHTMCMVISLLIVADL